MSECVTVLHRRYEVKASLPNPVRCYRCQKFGDTHTCCTSDMCRKCGVTDYGYTICPCPVQCVNYSGAHASSSLDCPIHLQETAIQKIRVEERLTFPETRKWHFDLQTKPMKITYAQDGASRPSNSEMSTRTGNSASVPGPNDLKFRQYQPRTQPKPADPPKQPRVRESRKESPHKQSPSDQYRDCVDDKSKGPRPNLKLSCEDLDMDISKNITNVRPACKLRRHSRSK